MPKYLLLVFDNCVGQNKSQLVLKFIAMLSMTIFKVVRITFLLPGHSHNAADRAIHYLKNSWKNQNIDTMDKFVLRANEVKNMVCDSICFDDNKRPCFKLDGWTAALSTLKSLPSTSTYTKSFSFHFVDGEMTMKHVDDSSESTLHTYPAESSASSKRHFLNTLYGTEAAKLAKYDVRTLFKSNAEINLERQFAPRKINSSRAGSIWEKLSILYPVKVPPYFGSIGNDAKEDAIGERDDMVPTSTTTAHSTNTNLSKKSRQVLTYLKTVANVSSGTPISSTVANICTKVPGLTTNNPLILETSASQPDAPEIIRAPRFSINLTPKLKRARPKSLSPEMEAVESKRMRILAKGNALQQLMSSLGLSSASQLEDEETLGRAWHSKHGYPDDQSFKSDVYEATFRKDVSLVKDALDSLSTTGSVKLRETLEFKHRVWSKLLPAAEQINVLLGKRVQALYTYPPTRSNKTTNLKTAWYFGVTVPSPKTTKTAEKLRVVFDDTKPGAIICQKVPLDKIRLLEMSRVEVGERVVAYYMGKTTCCLTNDATKWYPGKIVKKHALGFRPYAGTGPWIVYDIDYDDGCKETNVWPEYIRR